MHYKGGKITLLYLNVGQFVDILNNECVGWFIYSHSLR